MWEDFSYRSIFTYDRFGRVTEIQLADSSIAPTLIRYLGEQRIDRITKVATEAGSEHHAEPARPRWQPARPRWPAHQAVVQPARPRWPAHRAVVPRGARFLFLRGARSWGTRLIPLPPRNPPMRLPLPARGCRGGWHAARRWELGLPRWVARRPPPVAGNDGAAEVGGTPPAARRPVPRRLSPPRPTSVGRIRPDHCDADLGGDFAAARDVAGNDRVDADEDVVADGDIADQLGAGPDEDSVAEGRHGLDPTVARRPQSDLMRLNGVPVTETIAQHATTVFDLV